MQSHSVVGDSLEREKLFVEVRHRGRANFVTKLQKLLSDGVGLGVEGVCLVRKEGD